MANMFMTIDNEILLYRKQSDVEKALPINHENGGQINSSGRGKQLSGARACL